MKMNKAGIDLSSLDHREDGTLVPKTSFYSQNSAEVYSPSLATRAEITDAKCSDEELR